MRTIKFRGKTIAHHGLKETWVYGFYSNYKGVNGRTHYISDDSGHSYAVKFETVSQFTGVIDPNGQEIYENDIVGYTDSETKEVSVFGVVKYSSEGNFYINTHNCRNYEDDAPSANVGYMMPQHKALSIIGNIFDNKELLKIE